MGELIGGGGGGGGGGAGGAGGQVERGADPGSLEEKQGSSTKDPGKQKDALEIQAPENLTTMSN